MTDHEGITIEDIKRSIVPVLRRRGIGRSSVFGSCARGDARRDSDIDLLVDLPDGYRLIDVARLKAELEKSAGRRVDLVEYDAIQPSLRDEILSSQVDLL